jgi:hypothetical protein
MQRLVSSCLGIARNVERESLIKERRFLDSLGKSFALSNKKSTNSYHRYVPLLESFLLP